MLKKRNLIGANLCLASLNNVDCFDSPKARTSGKWNQHALEPSKCCPKLYSGDAVFYTEDVAHRTENFKAKSDENRYALSIKIDANMPMFNGMKEPRCASWNNYCHTYHNFMKCVCPDTCTHDEL